MKGLVRWLARGAAVGLIAVACAKVPYTNRSIGSAIPKRSLFQLGAATYAEMLAEVPLERGTPDAQLLQDVGRRIAGVANRPDFAWEFELIDQDIMNAWCLPGGYIAFYRGILPALHNESGMAFVMGHEVGHAIANHSGERMTAQLGVTGALTLVDALLSGSARVSPEQRGVILGAMGLGAQVGALLPFSRSHEKEADILGLMYMAKAGYPPRQSLDVWRRMGELSGGGAPPAFLSTHPSHDARISNLESWLPQARKKYQRAQHVAGAVAPRW